MTKAEKDFTINLIYRFGTSELLLQNYTEEVVRIEKIIASLKNIKNEISSGLSVDDDSMENTCAKTIEICKKRICSLNEITQEQIKDENIMNEIISGLEYDKQFIVKNRYIDKRPWLEIQAMYSVDMCTRNFYRRADEALEEILSKYKQVKGEKYINSLISAKKAAKK